MIEKPDGPENSDVRLIISEREYSAITAQQGSNPFLTHWHAFGATVSAAGALRDLQVVLDHHLLELRLREVLDEQDLNIPRQNCVASGADPSRGRAPRRSAENTIDVVKNTENATESVKVRTVQRLERNKMPHGPSEES